MSAPQIYDFELVRGTNEPIIFRFTKGGVAISFDDARFSVYAGKKFLFRLSIEEGGVLHTDPETGEITIYPSAAQTRQLEQTRDDGAPRNSYEIELRNSAENSERVYVLGAISGIGGINDDEVEPS